MIGQECPVALVVLNPAARGGRGRALWSRVRPVVAAQLSPKVVEIDRQGRWQEAIAAALAEGVNVFIAAGGDGTVNALVNALVRAKRLRSTTSFVLGAVGLGSSNDFHKPYGHVESGVPLKINVAGGGQRDIGVARYLTPEESEEVRYFVVSASIGVTAEANAFFNQGDRLLHAFKSGWTGGAIIYAALQTIATYRNIAAQLTADAEIRETAITNLSVLKTPYLSGAFRFDTPVAPDDGLFAVNLCEGMSRGRMLLTLVDLARGRFLGKTGRWYWRVDRLEVETKVPVALELDGEVYQTRRVRFAVLPDKIAVCR